MKKLMLFMAAALMLLACSKEDSAPKGTLQQGNNRGMIFHAITEGAPVSGTKVYADEDLKLLWDNGDFVSIFEKNNTNVKYVATVEGGNSVDLSPAEGDDAETTTPDNPEDLDHYYAIYPYSNAITVSKEADAVSFGLSLPDVQNYKEKSFGINANTMVAVSDGQFLPFKNVCGYLCFRFYGKGVKVASIKLEGKNGEKLAGNAIVTAVFERFPTVTMQDSATGSITLECGGVELSSAPGSPTEFIFVVPPTEFTKGFKVTVTGTNGETFEMRTPDSFSLKIQRSRMEFMAAKEIIFKSKYELVTLDKEVKTGDYVLAYHNGNGGFNLFSFTKTMNNAKAAADMVAGDHGLEALLARGSEIYSKVVGKNYVTVAGDFNLNPDEATTIDIPSYVEDSVTLSVTGNANSAQLTLVSGDYSLRLTKVITKINNDNSATLAVQPNAPDVLNIMYDLRGGKVVITFNDLINFAVTEAGKEGVTITEAQESHLRSGFEKLCKLAKEVLANHGMPGLMDITLDTDVFEVIAQYYDNAADYSLDFAEDKKFGWATPIGFYAGDNGFTANISLPQAGWFDRIQQSLSYGNGSKADFVAYWATIDALYENKVGGIDNFFQRLANRFVNELDDETFSVLKTVEFSKIGRVYGNYVERFNDDLEPVYLFKKIVNE